MVPFLKMKHHKPLLHRTPLDFIIETFGTPAACEFIKELSVKLLKENIIFHKNAIGLVGGRKKRSLFFFQWRMALLRCVPLPTLYTFNTSFYIPFIFLQ